MKQSPQMKPEQPNQQQPQYSAQPQQQQYNQEFQMVPGGSNYVVNQSPPVAQYQQQIYLRPQGHD
jgi:hypothetical protein